MDQSAIHRYFSRRNRREDIHIYSADGSGLVFATDRLCMVNVTPYASRFSWCRQALEQPGHSLTIPPHSLNEGATTEWWGNMGRNWNTWVTKPSLGALVPTAVVVEGTDGEQFRLFRGESKLLAINVRMTAMLGATLGQLQGYVYTLIDERGMVRISNQEQKVVMLTMGLTGMASQLKLNGAHVEVPLAPVVVTNN